MLKELHDELAIIVAQKKAQLPSIPQESIDHAVHGEEIKDGEFAIQVINDSGLTTKEKRKHLKRVYTSTTSGRIYDTMAKLFPELKHHPGV
jgi:hypothetical protein